MARNGGFPGMGGGNMQQLMRQAQKMQQDMLRITMSTSRQGKDAQAVQTQLK